MVEKKVVYVKKNTVIGRQLIDIKQIRKLSGFENLNEEEALIVAESIKIFADILVDFYMMAG